MSARHHDSVSLRRICRAMSASVMHAMTRPPRTATRPCTTTVLERLDERARIALPPASS